jgi:hypothetical protein
MFLILYIKYWEYEFRGGWARVPPFRRWVLSGKKSKPSQLRHLFSGEASSFLKGERKYLEGEKYIYQGKT